MEGAAGAARRGRGEGAGGGGKIAGRRWLIDRYGRELEWDFTRVGAGDVAQFWVTGRWARFDSFVEQFETDPRSWLSWAKTNDVELYEAAQDAGTLRSGDGRIETFEWGQTNTQLHTVTTLLAQLIHVTAVKGSPKQKKKFKPPKLAWPATAVDALKERVRNRRLSASKSFLDSMFEFVPQAEFDADVAEHEAAVAQGLPSPVVERAEARARRDPSPTVRRGGLGVPADG